MIMICITLVVVINVAGNPIVSKAHTDVEFVIQLTDESVLVLNKQVEMCKVGYIIPRHLREIKA